MRTMLGMHSPTHDPPHPDGGLPPALGAPSSPPEKTLSFNKQLTQLEAVHDIHPFADVEELARYYKLFQPVSPRARRHHQPGCRWKPKHRTWVCADTCVQPKAALAVQMRDGFKAKVITHLSEAMRIETEAELLKLAAERPSPTEEELAPYAALVKRMREEGKLPATTKESTSS